MSQFKPNEESLTQAALYALGALEGEELRAFEQRVAEGCSLCQAVESFKEVASQLGTTWNPVQPRPELRQKLFERVKSESAPQSLEQSASLKPSESLKVGLTFVKAETEGWQEVAPGIKLKPLFFDQAQGRMTALARMEAGCNHAIHRHDKPEELYVLEGTCYVGGRILRPGDYHRAEAETIHYETSTTDGCLMFVIFSPTNEMLDPVSS